MRYGRSKNTKRHLAELNTWAQSLAIIVAVRVYNGHLILIGFFKGCPGQGANLGFSFIFSLNCSALDHSATAPP